MTVNDILKITECATIVSLYDTTNYKVLVTDMLTSETRDEFFRYGAWKVVSINTSVDDIDMELVIKEV